MEFEIVDRGGRVVPEMCKLPMWVCEMPSVGVDRV